MKKIFLFTPLICALICCSCTKEDYLQYDQGQKDAVYFDYTSETDSVFYNFGFESFPEHIINVKVKLMGMPKDYDREFKIRTVNDRYADKVFLPAPADYFVLPEKVVIAKDSVQATIPVVLKRNTALETSRAILTLELTATNDLEVRGQIEFTITFDDMLPIAPAWWKYSTYFLGNFSKAKAQVFFEYFWKMEATDKYFYDLIVTKFGRELNKRTSPYDNPFNDYPVIMKQKVQLPLWEYQEANPGKFSGVTKPTF